MKTKIKNSENMTFNEQLNVKYDINDKDDTPQLQFQTLTGKLFFGDSLKWLSTLKAKSVDLCFADPPYNIKKAEWDKFSDHEEYIDWCLQWIKEVSRVLKDEGTLYVCGFSEILADLKRPAMEYFKGCRWLVWHYKNKANLGKDWGRSHESILHFRKSKKFTLNIDEVRIPYGNHTLKYPSHPQAETSQYGKNGENKNHVWTPHPKGAKPKDVFEIPVTNNGSVESNEHPTQKPEELLRRIILASSNTNELVLDPFSGSGTTLVTAEQLNRNWIGCDNNASYNLITIDRLNNITIKSEKQWIAYDQTNFKRRESIR